MDYRDDILVYADGFGDFNSAEGSGFWISLSELRVLLKKGYISPEDYKVFIRKAPSVVGADGEVYFYSFGSWLKDVGKKIEGGLKKTGDFFVDTTKKVWTGIGKGVGAVVGGFTGGLLSGMRGAPSGGGEAPPGMPPGIDPALLQQQAQAQQAQAQVQAEQARQAQAQQEMTQQQTTKQSGGKTKKYLLIAGIIAVVIITAVIIFMLRRKK